MVLIAAAISFKIPCTVSFILCFISGVKETQVKVLHIAIGTSLSVFFCIVLLIIGVYCGNKLRLRDRHCADLDHVEVRYVAATSGSNTTDRLLTLDQSDASKSPEQVDHEIDNNHTEAVTSVDTETPDEQVENRENHTAAVDHVTPPHSGTVTVQKIQKVSIV